MQHKETMRKENTSEKRSHQNKNDSSNQQHQNSGTRQKDMETQHRGQEQNNHNKNQQRPDHGSNKDWKNQKDESEIETPGKLREDDDADETEKKLPQMNKQDKHKI